jgi:hypothetical protein
MSILVRFAPPSMTTAQYEEVKSSVSGPSGLAPDGLELHVCFGEEGARRVTEVWTSMGQFQAFGEHLMPAIQAAGIPPHEPEVLPVRSMRVSDAPVPPDDTGLVVRFRPRSLTLAQYDQVSARLGSKVAMPPDGARAHVVMGEDGTLQVGEVWASAGQFDTFFQTLRPLLEEAGISPAEPERFPHHSLVITDAARSAAHV